MDNDTKLSEFELDVMNLFWQHGQASAPQIHEWIKTDKDVSYSTVKTIIDRLEQKEAVVRAAQQGRTIYYAAAIARETFATPLLKGFLKRLFAGDPHMMVAQLLDNEQLNDEEIDKLQSLLAAQKAKNQD